MVKKDIKSALKGSLIKEEQAIKDRFEKAETLLAEKGRDAVHVVASGAKKKETVILTNTHTELKVIQSALCKCHLSLKIKNQKSV